MRELHLFLKVWVDERNGKEDNVFSKGQLYSSPLSAHRPATAVRRRKDGIQASNQSVM